MPETPEAGTRGLVLAVDDTPETLAMLTEALEGAGYTALVAISGEAALSVCERITPDLVLMDAAMPGLGGFEGCRRLKAQPALAHVPVIFMTALSETEHVVQGLAAGGVDYLTKPIVLDELFARMGVHLANARSAQSTRLALDTAGTFLLAVDATGTLLWSTPQAALLLEAALGRRDALPDAARQAVAETLAVGTRASAITAATEADGSTLALTFIGAAGAGEFLFQLARRGVDGDILRRRFGLTGREAQVLTWVARGKSNRDIGEILDLSPRTVNKHLEMIFRKLGVENRASAAVLASRVLASG